MGIIEFGIKKLEGLKHDLELFKEDQHAEIGKLFIASIIAIVALVVIAILGSALLPSAIEEINGTNTTGWTSTGAASMWGSLNVFIVLGFLLIILGIALYTLKALDM